MAPKPTTKPPTAKKSKKPLSFRPPQDVYDLLEKRAAEMQITINDLACHYVTKAFKTGNVEPSPMDPVVELIAELREDLAVSVEAMLSSAGKVSEADARRWADKNLRH
jgi:hypothetical protein